MIIGKHIILWISELQRPYHVYVHRINADILHVKLTIITFGAFNNAFFCGHIVPNAVENSIFLMNNKITGIKS